MIIPNMLRQHDRAGYIAMRIAPISREDANRLIDAIMYGDYPFVALCGLLRGSPCRVEAVCAVKPFPITNADFRAAALAIANKFAPLMPKDALCLPRDDMAMRTVIFLTKYDLRSRRDETPPALDLCLDWTSD